MMRRLPLRLRVATAFALSTAVALVALGAFVYYRVEATLLDRTEASLEAQLDALGRVPEASRAQATGSMTGEFLGQLLSPAGRVLASSPQVAGALMPPGSLPRGEDGDVAVQRPFVLAGEDEPEPTLLLARRQGHQVVVVGTSREDVEDALGGVLTQLLIGGPLALVLAAGLGYVVAGVALRPIERMRRRAAHVSARSSGERLPLPVAHDELHRLGRTLNEMLDRLDAALRHERRFVAEAGHELRTPLALLRMELDLALEHERPREELVEALRSASEEVERLTALSEDLLVLAGSDEGRLALHREDVEVAPLLAEVARRFATRAAAEGRRVVVSDGCRARVVGDRGRLDQAVSNLADNALRHSEGDVVLDASSHDGKVSVEVRDEGPGIASGLREEAFDRFRRAPGTRTAEGRGLGLAIVRAIVEQHGGTVTISPGEGAYGTVVRIDLAAAPDPAP